MSALKVCTEECIEVCAEECIADCGEECTGVCAVECIVVCGEGTAYLTLRRGGLHRLWLEPLAIVQCILTAGL